MALLARPLRLHINGTTDREWPSDVGDTKRRYPKQHRRLRCWPGTFVILVPRYCFPSGPAGSPLELEAPAANGRHRTHACGQRIPLQSSEVKSRNGTVQQMQSRAKPDLVICWSAGSLASVEEIKLTGTMMALSILQRQQTPPSEEEKHRLRQPLPIQNTRRAWKGRPSEEDSWGESSGWG